MDSIDKLLAEVKAEYEAPKQEKAPAPQPTWRTPQPSQDPQNWQAPRNHLDSLLNQVKTEFVQQDKAEEVKKEQQLKEEALRLEQLKQKKQEALAKRAQEWLKKLDPLSSEGLWFEDFAEGYPSKLEAAIDYLQAMQEINPE